jgi:H+-transporting ATPase
VIQSIIFTKLVVAGHLTIFLTRTEDWFWKRPFPSGILFWVNLLTAILGTLIAVYGFLITPIGWRTALYIWAYALSWLLFNDIVKMATYRMLRRLNLSQA